MPNRINTMLRTLLSTAVVACSGLFAAESATAQSREIPAPPQDRPIILANATVHPISMDGVPADPIDGGYVIFEDGRITDVDHMPLPDERDRPDDYDLIDVTDLHVYPGLVALNSQLGLQETSSVDETIDHNERGEFTPEVRAAVAINPDTDLIPVARHNGILLGGIFPRGGLISGRGSAMRFDGWTWEDMTIDADAGLIVNWPRTEPISSAWMSRSESEQREDIAERLDSIDSWFDDAEAYLKARAHEPATPRDLRFDGMRASLEGETPIFVRASSRGQIESAVGWAQRRGYEIVIVGGHEADRCTDLLVEHGIDVIIDGLHRLPNNRHDDYDQPFTVPKVLHEAGVRFAISSGTSPAHERNLNHNAATAAAYGLPKSEAIRAVTQSAAAILGIGEDYGTIEAGKSATLIVTTGDPLEITTDTLVAYIDGRRVDLGNRQTALYEKYLEKYRQLGLRDEP